MLSAWGSYQVSLSVKAAKYQLRVAIHRRLDKPNTTRRRHTSSTKVASRSRSRIEEILRSRSSFDHITTTIDRPVFLSLYRMWPFTSSSSSPSSSGSTSKSVAADLEPPINHNTPSTSLPTPPPSAPSVPSIPTASGPRLNIPSGNSPISEPSEIVDEKLSGDKWTDYKAALQVCPPHSSRVPSIPSPFIPSYSYPTVLISFLSFSSAPTTLLVSMISWEMGDGKWK